MSVQRTLGGNVAPAPRQPSDNSPVPKKEHRENDDRAEWQIVKAVMSEPHALPPSTVGYASKNCDAAQVHFVCHALVVGLDDKPSEFAHTNATRVARDCVAMLADSLLRGVTPLAALDQTLVSLQNRSLSMVCVIMDMANGRLHFVRRGEFDVKCASSSNHPLSFEHVPLQQRSNVGNSVARSQMGITFQTMDFCTKDVRNVHMFVVSRVRNSTMPQEAYETILKMYKNKRALNAEESKALVQICEAAYGVPARIGRIGVLYIHVERIGGDENAPRASSNTRLQDLPIV